LQEIAQKVTEEAKELRTENSAFKRQNDSLQKVALEAKCVQFEA
jgi:hypothetical protein